MGRSKTDEERQQLSDRELTIAKRLAYGERNAEIARELKISIKTVDTHRLHVLQKLRLKNNVQLARHMLRVGLVEL